MDVKKKTQFIHFRLICFCQHIKFLPKNPLLTRQALSRYFVWISNIAKKGASSKTFIETLSAL